MSEKNDGLQKNIYFCVMEEMITIRRSDYEQMLKQLADLQDLVKHLREEHKYWRIKFCKLNS
jgi:hypothetical protein